MCVCVCCFRRARYSFKTVIVATFYYRAKAYTRREVYLDGKKKKINEVVGRWSLLMEKREERMKEAAEKEWRVVAEPSIKR